MSTRQSTRPCSLSSRWHTRFENGSRCIFLLGMTPVSCTATSYRKICSVTGQHRVAKIPRLALSIGK